MPSLKDLLVAAKQDLPITVLHEQWLVKHSDEPFSPEALAFAQKVLSKEVGGGRPHVDFRISSINSCMRAQLFTVLRVQKKKTLDGSLANIFATGNFLHLKWQMAGLTAGWLSQAEVPFDVPELSYGGTLDGILFDGSGFEFKSINSRGWNYVMAKGQPSADHVRQVHGYMVLAPQINAFSVVYENKDSGEWREFRVPRDPEIEKDVRETMERLRQFRTRGVLPEELSMCKAKEGSQYRYCAYKSICPTYGAADDGLPDHSS